MHLDLRISFGISEHTAELLLNPVLVTNSEPTGMSVFHVEHMAGLYLQVEREIKNSHCQEFSGMFKVDPGDLGYTCTVIIHQSPNRSCLSVGVPHGDFCYLFQVENVLAGDAVLFLSYSRTDLEIGISTSDQSVKTPGKDEICFII